MTDAIEWVWTIVNGVGVVFLLLVLRELWDDRLAAMEPSDTNGRRGIWVFIIIRHELLFLILQALFLWAGIAAIQRPNALETDATQFGGLVSILFALVMDVLTLLDLRDRNRIRNYAGGRDERTHP